MKSFTSLTSACLTLSTENIDTDQIIPARFLKITSREGFGKYLFYDWRFDQNGKPKKNKYFDESINRSTKILIAGNNFGCGSSREHAVWALMDYGFNVVISSSFGDIFYNNALKNGLLPVILKSQELEILFHHIEKNRALKVIVDLEKLDVQFSPSRSPFGHLEGVAKPRTVWYRTKRLLPGEHTIRYHFFIDSFQKTCLLKGVDELGYILSFENKIKDFEKSHQIFIST